MKKYLDTPQYFSPSHCTIPYSSNIFKQLVDWIFYSVHWEVAVNDVVPSVMVGVEEA